MIFCIKCLLAFLDGIPFLTGRAFLQLRLAEFAACPSTRHGKHDERKWIPMRPEGGSLVPGHCRTHNTHDKSHNAARQGMCHGSLGREPRCDVACHDAVDSAVGRRKQEGFVATGWPHGGKTPIACSTMSVPRERMTPATMPATTAPMLRPICDGRCVSLMTLSVLSPSQMLPATPTTPPAGRSLQSHPAPWET